ncbi:hypothetical protein DFH08DRAFT_819777 [Mycena albidolilacea]|uniref:Uncharacterized protein n=1 Tax=Mycena albidolilacea TaxID=1033008 RepID=A0AAD6ZDT9_9AGAR|nr:hypothetical protein DFH08DRAFT_819777 [Mycena albidolilacea]
MLDPSTRFHRTDIDTSLVKKWLMLQAYRAEGEELCPLEGDAVLCTVSRTYSKAARLRTLLLTGIVSVEISPCLHARKIPAVILDTSLGIAHLSTAMIEWAGAISVGTWAQSCSLGPSIPQKPTTPNNFKPIRPCALTQHTFVIHDYESDEPESDGEGSVSWDEDNYELEPLPALLLQTLWILAYLATGSAIGASIPSRLHVSVRCFLLPKNISPLPLSSSSLWLMSSSKLVPCACPECDGALVSRTKRNHHEARERRQQSASGGGLIRVSAHAVLSSASTARQGATQLATLQPLPVHASSVAFVAEDITADTTSTTSFVVAAEAEGLSHSQQVEASGELFLPISADDWELPDPSLDLAGDNSTERPLRAEDENNPDPFYIVPKAAQRLPTATEVHPNRAVYLIYVVIFWLPLSRL